MMYFAEWTECYDNAETGNVWLKTEWCISTHGQRGRFAGILNSYRLSLAGRIIDHFPTIERAKKYADDLDTRSSL